MTAAEINALDTPALLALYNRLTGKAVKRFASRAAGLKQTLRAQATQNAKGSVGSVPGAAQLATEAKAPAAQKVKPAKTPKPPKPPKPPKVKPAKAPKPPKELKVRTVRGSASGADGRPKSNYIVQLTESKAKSKPQAESDRMKLVVYLRTASMQHKGVELKQAAKFSTIEANDDFKGINLKGVIQKLADKSWLVKLPLE